MTYPQALTWLHLVPHHARCESAGGPDQFRAALHACGGDGPRLLVAWGKTPGELQSLDGYAGVAAINCRGMNDERLKAAGFGHIRRFAVLPSLDHARWFVPLDSGAVSAAAFSLYTPARVSARLKRRLARAAAFARLPGWYRDHLCLALRTASPLEQAMARLFPSADVRLALSSGAPDGARNRKASAAAVDRGGNVLAFLKLARSELSRRRVRHEADALQRLAMLPNVTGITPRLLFDGEVDGTYVAAQSPLPGRTVPLRFGPMHQRFLEHLHGPATQPASDCEMVRDLRQRIRELPEPRPRLLAVFEDVMPQLERLGVPSTVVHGDFAPWNLRHHDGEITAFDWEYAHLDGLPGIDALHYLLQTGYLLGRWPVERALAEMRHAAPRPVQVIYLLDHLVRLLGEGYDDANDMIAWLSQLLARASEQRRETAVV